MHLSVEQTHALVGQLEQIVLKKISGDALALPVMPAIAERCLRLLRDPSTPLKKIVATLEQDPMLAASMFKKAQAAAFGPGHVTSLSAAISRLGMQRLKTALLEDCAKKMFESRDQRIAAALHGLWEHSVAVAMLARDLVALMQAQVDPDAAYLCGLLHDVGKPVFAALLLEAERSLVRGGGAWIDPEQWVASINRHHRKVGIALAEKWKLPEEIQQGIRETGDYDAASRDTIANFVRFTNALAKREGFAVGTNEPAEVDALIMIGRSLLGLDDDLIARLSGGLSERLKAQLAG